jgi:uncharacterized protein (TIGR03067 family)
MRTRTTLLLLVVLAVGFAPAPFRRAARPKKEGDLDRMQGTWAVVERRYAGNVLKVENAQVTLRGSRWHFVFNGEVRSRWDVRLDPTTAPRSLDYFSADGNPTSVLPAIYRLDGDTLTVCYTQGKDRPTGFDNQNGHWSMVLKRVTR